MKKVIQNPLLMEPRTIALVLALAVGLGLAVHENFFAAGLAVLAFVAAHWTTQKAREYLRGFNSLRMGRVYNKLGRMRVEVRAKS